MKQIGQQAVRILFSTLKDETHHRYKVELDLLSRIAGRPLMESKISDAESLQVLAELGKQKLIQPSPKGWKLTALGTWYITSAPE